MYNKQLSILRSVVTPNAIQELVNEWYGAVIGRIKSCKLLKAWGSNDIYLISTSDRKYIVKLYSIRSCWSFNKRHLLFELELPLYLQNQGIKVAIPVRNKDSKLITECIVPEYNKYLSLHIFIEPQQGDNELEETYVSLGKSLATFHIKSKNFSPKKSIDRNLNIDFLINQPLKRIRKLAHITSKELWLEIEQTAQHLYTSLEQLNFHNFKQTIIHGDVHCGNYVFSKEGIALIDFELCGYGKAVYDLAILYWDITLFKEKQIANRIWDSFIKGYQSINEIPKEEVDSIVTLAKVRHFFMIGSSYILYPEMTKFNTQNRILKDMSRFADL